MSELPSSMIGRNTRIVGGPHDGKLGFCIGRSESGALQIVLCTPKNTAPGYPKAWVDVPGSDVEVVEDPLYDRFDEGDSL